MTWHETTLGEHIDLISGPAFKSRHFTDDPSDVPLVKGENIGQGKILWSKSKFWPQADTESYERFVLKPGDVILAMDRPWVTAGLKYAVIHEHDPQALLVQRVARLRGKNGLSSRFLRYIIGSTQFSAYVKGIMGGTNVPHISGDQIRAFKFRFPPHDEQERVAEILSSYDDLIENNRRRIQLLEESARLIYKEWFVHRHFPGHEHVRIVNGVPEGWLRETLTAHVTVTRGKSYKSSDLVESGGKPFVNLKCVARYGGFRLDGLKRFIGKHKKEQTVRAGDIVMAVTDMTRERHIVAHPARVPAAIAEECVFSMDTVKLTPHPTVDPDWFYYFLRFSTFSNEVREHATGTNVLHLKPAHIASYLALMPTRQLQREFGVLANRILRQQDVLTTQNERLRTARDILLPRLMNGEVSV